MGKIIKAEGQALSAVNVKEKLRQEVRAVIRRYHGNPDALEHQLTTIAYRENLTSSGDSEQRPMLVIYLNPPEMNEAGEVEDAPVTWSAMNGLVSEHAIAYMAAAVAAEIQKKVSIEQMNVALKQIGAHIQAEVGVCPTDPAIAAG